ncbi:MAG: DNA mismatch repair protein MutH [Myxococcales bacterium]|nr:DNA mismatch repair protein MutH [Myxococcales bacterium]
MVHAPRNALAAPPLDVDELCFRARGLDGLTIGELARRLGVTLPDEPRRAKGVVGELVELALGATAGSLDLPDFPQLGVELKTVPVDEQGRVTESTYVCAIDLDAIQHAEWRGSRVRRKLACVLWMPVQAAKQAILSERHLGTPLLWRMRGEAEAAIEADWRALVGRIAVGGIDEISAHLGEVLQIRPKARSASERVVVRGADGVKVETVRRGFYLRAAFTEAVLWGEM